MASLTTTLRIVTERVEIPFFGEPEKRLAHAAKTYTEGNSRKSPIKKGFFITILRAGEGRWDSTEWEK